MESLKGLKIFDCHFHIIDRRFPLVSNQGYLPEYFTCQDYLRTTKNLNIMGGAVVSGSFQAFDYSYLLAALKELGQEFVGVVNLRVTASDEEILMLHKSRIRGVRFNLFRGGSEAIEHLKTLAKRIHELAGWHVELYVDSRQLKDLYPTITSLPAVSVDHLGLSKEGFSTLLRLVEKGIRVKATGFGRVNMNVKEIIQAICQVDPVALMFGTDLPSTRAPRPFRLEDVLMVLDALGEELAQRVFYRNAVHFYRIEGPR